MSNTILDENLVCKLNTVINASYSLTLTEQRVMLCFISTIDSRKPINSKNTYSISINAYANMFNITLEHTLKEIPLALDKLYTRSIHIKTKLLNEKFKLDNNITNAQIDIRWIQEKGHFNKGDDRFSIKFSESIIPFLSELHGNFTKYNLSSISKLKTSYAIRFYELLAQHQNMSKSLNISISELRLALQIDNNKYTTFGNLNNRVIKPSLVSISELTNLKISNVQQIKKNNLLNKRETTDLKITFHVDTKTKKNKKNNITFKPTYHGTIKSPKKPGLPQSQSSSLITASIAKLNKRIGSF